MWCRNRNHFVDEFMLLVMKDKYVNRVLEVWPEFKVDKKVGECKYTITYHMVKE